MGQITLNAHLWHANRPLGHSLVSTFPKEGKPSLVKIQVFVTHKSYYGHGIIHEKNEILLVKFCNIPLIAIIYYLSISHANFKFNQITLWHSDSWDSCDGNEET